MRPEIRGIARDNAVEVFGVALRFRQRLLSALRAAAEIGALRRGAIERANNRFIGLRGYMNGAMGEVDNPLHVPLCPMPIVIGGVARIRAAGCIPAL